MCIRDSIPIGKDLFTRSLLFFQLGGIGGSCHHPAKLEPPGTAEEVDHLLLIDGKGESNAHLIHARRCDLDAGYPVERSSVLKRLDDAIHCRGTLALGKGVYFQNAEHQNTFRGGRSGCAHSEGM